MFRLSIKYCVRARDIGKCWEMKRFLCLFGGDALCYDQHGLGPFNCLATKQFKVSLNSWFQKVVRTFHWRRPRELNFYRSTLEWYHWSSFMMMYHVTASHIRASFNVEKESFICWFFFSPFSFPYAIYPSAYISPNSSTIIMLFIPFAIGSELDYT